MFLALGLGFLLLCNTTILKYCLKRVLTLLPISNLQSAFARIVLRKSNPVHTGVIVGWKVRRWIVSALLTSALKYLFKMAMSGFFYVLLHKEPFSVFLAASSAPSRAGWVFFASRALRFMLTNNHHLSTIGSHNHSLF